jgi:hypothetical protein
MSVFTRPVGLGVAGFVLWNTTWLLSPITPSALSWVVPLIGLPIVVLLPGLLIVTALGARRASPLNAVFAIGFGLLFLYVVGLGANFLPRLLGHERPLDTPAVWILFNLGCLIAAVPAFRVHRQGLPEASTSPRPTVPRPWWVAPGLAAAAVVAPVLAVLGAITLNNGGGNGLALRALVLVVLVAPAGFWLRHRVGDRTLITVIVATTAALLLATSMRGWYVTGQDLQHEFQVFALAREQGRWDVSTYQDPYNACLSLTLLPVSLSQLLHLDGALVFKLVFQLLFCTVPVTLFCSTRRFLGRGGGYLVAVLFVGLPTFSIDVPFITRQQIAFIFVALAVASVFSTDEAWIRRHRTTVLVSMSAGVVVSHYTTSYLFLAGLIATFGLYGLYRLAVRLRQRVPDRERITALSILGAVLVAAVWLGPVTHASGDLMTKLGKSAPSILDLAGDPGLALDSLGRPNAEAGSELQEYVASSAVQPRPDVSAIARGLQLTGSEDRPPSEASRWVSEHVGIDPATVLSSFYYGIGTKLYLLCCGVGTLLLFSRRIRARFRDMPVLYPIWAVSAALVVGLQVLLPDLAADYGVSRTFMQAFIVLCVPMVITLKLISARWRNGLSVAVPAILLVVYSGLGPQLTGGLHRQLSLENAGSYYGTVYPTDTDAAAVTWIGNNLPRGSKVNVADFAAVYGYHPTYDYDFTSPGLFPFQVKPGDYVVLSGSQTQDHVVYTFESRVGLRISPETYADAQLVYSSGTIQVFRRN